MQDVLVLCSAEGDIALWLAQKVKGGSVTGLELDDELRHLAEERASERGLQKIVRFQKAEKKRIPFPDESFDTVVSEFILFPTSNPTEIGQREMARVLRHGGTIALTDVIATRIMPNTIRQDLKAIGLDYLCDGTMDDFRRWMSDAGLIDVLVTDCTTMVRKVWEDRRDSSLPIRRREYEILLENPELRLGRSIFYIYAKGRKP